MPETKYAVLKIPMGDATGKKEFSILTELMIGRDAKNDIVIPNLNVSRKHAKVFKDESGCYWLEDLGSHNGTLLNGRLARKEKLQENDVILIADAELTFFGSSTAPAGADDKKISQEDLGVIGCNSTSFIDLSELKKETMEDLRKKKPSITDHWKE